MCGVCFVPLQQPLVFKVRERSRWPWARIFKLLRTPAASIPQNQFLVRINSIEEMILGTWTTRFRTWFLLNSWNKFFPPIPALLPPPPMNVVHWGHILSAWLWVAWRAGRYNKTKPEANISPQSVTKNLAAGHNIKFPLYSTVQYSTVPYSTVQFRLFEKGSHL